MAGAAAMIAYGLFLSWAFRTDRLPLQAVFVPLVLSVITFVVYALDKHAAQTGRWRTSESTLHLLELAGGWPGAWIAQQTLRHKSCKPGYRAVFWMMVVLHAAALVA
ncbi:DUF1294 domain-containing protein [Pseudoxanthomonas mexicana]